jgi:hypothetical protein
MLKANYYSLDVANSNINEAMMAIYKDVNDGSHGGRYAVILNTPIYTSSNVPLTQNTSEKGLEIAPSSAITVMLDPIINLRPKSGDLISFQFDLPDYYGIYRVQSIEDSGTLHNRYARLNIILVPGVREDLLKPFVNNILIFVPEFHYVFQKDVAIMIHTINTRLYELQEYFNDIYHDPIDLHILSSNIGYPEFEYAFTRTLSKYPSYLINMDFDRSWSFKIIKADYKNSLFAKLVEFDPDYVVAPSYSFTAIPKSRENLLERTKASNDVYKVYVSTEASGSDGMTANCSCSQCICNSDLIIPSADLMSVYLKWSDLQNPKSDLRNDVRDSLTKYISDTKLFDDPICNLVFMAQLLYIANEFKESQSSFNKIQ